MPKKKSSISRSRFQAIFPGFISKSSGVENSILKEKWRGGGESWMKKRGVYGAIIQPPPKKNQSSSFSYTFPIYHFHECWFTPNSSPVMTKMPQIWPVMGELLINIRFECVLFTVSPPLSLGQFCYAASTRKDCNRWATLVAIIPGRRAKKFPFSLSFLFFLMQIVHTPLSEQSCMLTDASCQ